MNKRSHFVGILGSMGPLATADFLSKLVLNTPANKDQDHIPVILHGDCTIPDRIEFINGKGPSPLPQLSEGIRFLNDCGVGVICMPCNTAHIWHAQLAAMSQAPLLHIVQSSADQISKKNPLAKKIGLLSTHSTHLSGLYHGPLQDRGFEVVSPTEKDFKVFINPAIDQVKANQIIPAEKTFTLVAQSLRERGAEVIILGCTEIPVVMKKQLAEKPSMYIDSNQALAQAVIDFFQNTKASAPQIV